MSSWGWNDSFVAFAVKDICSGKYLNRDLVLYHHPNKATILWESEDAAHICREARELWEEKKVDIDRRGEASDFHFDLFKCLNGKYPKFQIMRWKVEIRLGKVKKFEESPIVFDEIFA